MINFRYHIVSLMAVFLALSVGIVLGVTLRGPVDEGLVQQAATDRRQVSDLRAELDRRDALDDYRDAWAERGGAELSLGALADRSVAVVTMPDAPAATVDALTTAVEKSGGTVTHTVRVNADAFDPAKADAMTEALESFSAELQVTDDMSNGTRFGLALGRAAFSKQVGERDALATQLTEALTEAGMISMAGRSTGQAELALVVTARAAVPRVEPAVLSEHVAMDVALKRFAAGVVVAGPNSEQIEGTDVLAARIDSNAADAVSTVDVADLASGVTSTVLAGKEQLLGRQGHYGALARADSPLPQLPVR